MKTTTRLEIYPAPSIPGAIPPSAEILQTLLAEDPNHTAALFSLGNIFLRQGKAAEAADLYQQTLRLEPACAPARANLGLAYRLLGKTEEALSELSQAVLQDSELALAHLALGELQAERGAASAAIASFERLLRASPTDFRAWAALGDLHEKRGDIGQAKSCFAKAFAANAKHTHARNRLGEFCFLEGRRLFEQGELLQALATWAAGYRKYARAFIAEKSVAQGMSELVKEFNRSGGVQQAFAEYEAGLSGGGEGEDLHYPFFAKLCFSLGLMPEAYAERSAIEQEKARLSDALLQAGKFPFMNYRLGLLHAYSGELAAALEQLTFCDDFLPTSKKRPLKIEKIISLIKQAAESPASKTGLLEASCSMSVTSRILKS